MTKKTITANFVKKCRKRLRRKGPCDHKVSKIGLFRGGVKTRIPYFQAFSGFEVVTISDHFFRGLKTGDLTGFTPLRSRGKLAHLGFDL